MASADTLVWVSPIQSSFWRVVMYPSFSPRLFAAVPNGVTKLANTCRLIRGVSKNLVVTGGFVVIHETNPLKQAQLAYYKMGGGPFYVFYTPFHLPHLPEKVM